MTREAARLFAQVKGPGAFYAKATEEQAELLEVRVCVRWDHWLFMFCGVGCVGL
jgi:hypothetical protein